MSDCMSGPHPVHLEGDLIFSTAHGPTTLEGAKQFFAGKEADARDWLKTPRQKFFTRQPELVKQSD